MKNGLLTIWIDETREDLGRRAAAEIACAMRMELQEKSSLRMIFAAAPSQAEMLAALIQEPGIAWDRIHAFHMDEYLGLSAEAPQRFGTWLREAIFDRVPLASYRLIEPGDDPEETCRIYARELAEAPIDLVLCGVGANGHLAFNDPPADLEDPLRVKIVELDAVCRQQQVEDACFPAIDDVPGRAITLTVPMLLSGTQIFCCVPGSRKSVAVREMLEAAVSGECPATALRMHPRCTLYLDRESSALLGEKA